MSFNLFHTPGIAPTLAYLANGDAYGLISLIVTGIVAAGGLAYFIFGDADKKKLALGTMAFVCIPGFGLYVWLHYFNAPPPPPPPPVTHQWVTALQEFAPACESNDNSSGVATWHDDSSIPNQPTLDPITCTSNGLLMQRTNSQNGAEEDLDQLNGGAYSQDQFRAQVAIKFQTSLGDANTVSGLIVQTPISSTGGLIFDINNTGYWELKQVQTNAEPSIESGSVSISLNQLTTLEVDVQNGTLTGYINGQNVVTYNDSLDASSTIVGLVVEWETSSLSTPVLFENFRLDQWQ